MTVSEILNSETGWLNLTNAALGLAVLVCLIAVSRVVIQEIRVRATKRVRTPILHDDHAFSLESLGVTMADGGEPINEIAPQFRRDAANGVDPPNITRSEN
jgi:hypothetical protein